mgnify:CR=1 FL=1
MKQSMLEFSDATKIFETKNGPFVAVEGVNLRIEEGEFVSVMGHSGCGKSTLLNMVAGLSTCSRGGVSLRGREITEPGPERMVVFQNYSLLPWMNVQQNIHLAIKTCRKDLNRKEQKEETMRYIEMVGLSHAAHRMPKEISGGMKQRASIARALAVQPKVLLLDEPFGALDALTREELQDELLEIWEENRATVLMITHDVDEAIVLSDRIVLMTNGPAAGIGDIFDVPLQRPRDRESLLEDPAFYTLRNQVISYLYGKQGDYHEGDEAENTLIGAEAYTSSHPKEELQQA